LLQNFDHMDFGIYAQVVTPGDIAPGDEVTV
jgi:MOSC domain-containing protein YiiM